MMRNLWLIVLCSLCLNVISQTFSGSGLPIAQDTWDNLQDVSVEVVGLNNLTSGVLELVQVNIELKNEPIVSNISTSVAYKLISPTGTEIVLKPSGYYGPSSIKHFDVKFRDPCSQGGCDWFDSMSDLAGFSASEPFNVGYHRPHISCTFDDVVGENPNGTWIVRFEEQSASFIEPSILKVELVFGYLEHVEIINNPPNNSCNNPQVFCDNFPVCYNNSGMTGNASEDPEPGFDNCQWNMSLDNTGWFYWTANATTALIEVSGLQSNQQIIAVGNSAGYNTCDANDLYLLDGGCPEDAVNYNPSYSNGDNHNMELNLSNLTIGDTYYFVFDGNGGQVTSAYLTIQGAESCVYECDISDITINTSCPDENGNYYVEGEIFFDDPPLSGSLTITDDISGVTQVFTAPFSLDSQSYILQDIPYDGLEHTLTATFSDETDCILSIGYTVLDNVLPDFLQILPICVGEELNLPEVSSNGIFGTWSPVVDNTSTTTYVFIPDEGQCAISTSMTVVVNEEIMVDNVEVLCDESQDMYTVNFDITGGDINTYTVTPGGVLVGNIFTSNPIASGNSYNFDVSDGNNCNHIYVNGTNSCLCPVIASISGDVVICEGEFTNLEFNYSGGTGPYDLVYTDGLNTYSLNNQVGTSCNVTVSPTENTIYTLVSVNDINCEGSASGAATVQVNALPDISLSGDENICADGTANIVIGFTGNSSWELIYTDGISDINIEDIADNPYILNVSPLTTTTYSFTEVSDLNCSNSINESVTINIREPVSILNMEENCINDNSDFVVSFDIVGGDLNSYSVIPTGNLTASSFTSNPIASGGTYNFTVTDQYNCNIEEIGGSVDCSCPLVATISNNTTICAGDTAQIQILLEGGSPPYTFNYTDGVNTFTASSEVSLFEIEVAPDLTTSYTLISASDANCSGMVLGSAVVVVNPLPHLQLNNDHEICFGDSVDLTFLFSGTSPFDMSYSNGVDIVNLSGIMDSPYTLRVSPTSTSNYSALTVSDQNCLGMASGYSNVIVHQAIEIDAGEDIFICSGDSISLIAANPNNAEVSWNNGVEDNIPFVPELGDHSYILTAVLGTCIASDTVEISVGETIEFNIGNDTTICIGDTILLTPSLINSTWEYTWSTGEDMPNLLASPEVSTYYSLTINNGICSATEGVMINTSEISSLDIMGELKFCEGDSVRLEVDEAYNYLWNTGELVHYIYAKEAGLYTVTVSDINNCEIYLTTEIEQYSKPEFSIFSNVLEGCSPLSVRFDLEKGCELCSYHWMFDNDNFSSEKELEHEFIESGNHTVMFELTALDGCKYNEELSIHVFPKPNAHFTVNDNNVDVLNPEVVFTNYSECKDCQALYHSWDFGDGTGSFIENPEYAYDKVGKYLVELVVQTQNNCSDTASKVINVNEHFVVYFPTAFSPGPSRSGNNYFYPKGVSANFDNFLMIIYDRWGEPVYKSQEFPEGFSNKMVQKSGWNGRYMNTGAYVQNGIYAWYIRIMDNNMNINEYTGTVNVIR